QEPLANLRALCRPVLARDTDDELVESEGMARIGRIDLGRRIVAPAASADVARIAGRAAGEQSRLLILVERFRDEGRSPPLPACIRSLGEEHRRIAVRIVDRGNGAREGDEGWIA